MVVLSQSTSFKLSLESILDGIKAVKWYGRCEVVSKKPLIIVDGAHNEQSINALIDTIRSIYPIGKVNTIFAIKRGKNRHKILKSISDISKTMYLVDDFSDKFVDAVLLKEELDEMKSAKSYYWRLKRYNIYCIK